MTIRGYVALFYGLVATAAVAFADDLGAKSCIKDTAMMGVSVDYTATEMPDEFEPASLGRWEQDDLPAYLTESPADLAKAEEGMAADAAL